VSDRKLILDAVATAVTTAAPLTGPAAPFLVLAASAIRAIEELVGPDKDALLDELAAMRARTDAALKAKHMHDRDDEPTKETPVGGKPGR
jgi:hypothetical protein